MQNQNRQLGSGNPALFMVSACITSMALGVIIAGIGPSYSTLAANMGTSVGEVSGVLSVLFAGGFIGQVVSGWMVRRFNIRVLTLFLMLTLAVCVFGFTLSRSLPLALAFGLLAGLVDGPIGIVLNLTLTMVYRERATQRIGVTSTFFGMGSVLCPAVISVAIGAGFSPLVGLWGGALMVLLVAVPFALSIDMRPYQQLAALQEKPLKGQMPGRGPGLFMSPLFIVTCLLMLVYVGLEQGIGAWTTRYVSLTTAYGEATGAQVSAAYWLAFTFSRLLIGTGRLKIRSLRALTICLGGACLGSALLVLGHGSLFLTGAATVLIGLCFGPIFPVLFPITMGWFPDHAALAAGMINASGSLGGLLLNSLQGTIIENAGPAYNPIYAFSALLLLIGIYRLAVGMTRRQAPTPARAAVAPAGD